MKIEYGSTRTVLLTKRFAFKFPGRWCKRHRFWNQLLNGLQANMQEVEFSTIDEPKLCPIVFHIPGGFLAVMRRAEPLTRAEWCSIDIDDFLKHDDWTLPVETHQSSFGKLDGRIVAVDYGS